MTPLKIAVWHNLPSGGGKRALYHQVRGLTERGHHVEAWCPSSADRGFCPLDRLVTEHVNRVELTHEGKACRGPERVMRARQRRRAITEASREAAASIEKGGFDVVLVAPCRFHRAGPIGRFLAPPSVLYLQEPNRTLYEASPDLVWKAAERKEGEGMLSYGLRWARDAVLTQMLRDLVREETVSARAYDRILVNSFFSREAVLRAYGLESSVCPLGVDTDLFHAGAAKRERYVCSVGTLHWMKGADRALRIIGRIPASERPELVWAGNGADEQYAERTEGLAKELGVSLRIEVDLDDASLVGRMGRAAVFLYAPRLEPFGLAALEAGACETPVVAIAEGGVRETIVPEVNGVLADDERTAAEEVRNLLADTTRARSLGRSARAHVATRWSWDRAVTSLEEHLHEAVRLGKPA